MKNLEKRVIVSLTEIAADLSTGYQFLVLASRGLAILLFLKKSK
jgi:hypothetical protein